MRDSILGSGNSSAFTDGMTRETRGWNIGLEKQFVDFEDEELFCEGLRKGAGKQRTQRGTGICI